METSDSEIGRHVRAMRETTGLSQAMVAQRLTDAGVPGLYPQTMTKIESGLRPLRLAEAGPLARVLGVTVDDLLGPPSATVANDGALRAAVRQMHVAYEQMRDASFELIATCGVVEQGMEALRPLTPEVVDDARRDLAALTPERALDEAGQQIDDLLRRNRGE